VAEFTYIISGNAVVFNNLSQFGDSYLWNFGDGNTSTEENPTHFYETLGLYTVTLSVTNGCGTRTRSRSFNNLTLGVDEDVENTFGLYPNPASDELFITSAKDVNGTTVLEVTSLAGKRVMVQTVCSMNANGRLRLDVSGLGQGMYLLSVQSGEGRSVIRFNVTR
jgi:PKD repeat protein